MSKLEALVRYVHEIMLSEISGFLKVRGCSRSGCKWENGKLTGKLLFTCFYSQPGQTRDSIYIKSKVG